MQARKLIRTLAFCYISIYLAIKLVQNTCRHTKGLLLFIFLLLLYLIAFITSLFPQSLLCSIFYGFQSSFKCPLILWRLFF